MDSNLPLQVEERRFRQLIDVYGKSLDIEIIQSVAIDCKFDLTKSFKALDEIVQHINNPGLQENCISSTKRNVSPKKNGTKPKILCNKRVPENQSPGKKTKKDQHYDHLIYGIKKGTKTLILMRGLPGSGKSFLARKIVSDTVGSEYYNTCILSTDDYFIRKGVYRFEPTKLQDAHSANQQRAFNTMKDGISPIIIDNTHTQMWEMRAYAAFATSFAYFIEIIEPTTPWAFSDKELARRNSHGVPRAKIREMLDRYEKNITPQKLLREYNLIYRYEKPPQMRSYPPLEYNFKDSNSRSVDSDLANKFSKMNTVTLIPVNEASNVQNTVILDKDASLVQTKLIPITDDSNDVQTIVLTSNNDSKVQQNTCVKKLSLDDIFSCDKETNAEVLRPSTYDVRTEINDVSSRIYPELSLEAWGVTKEALVSWEAATPITNKIIDDDDDHINSVADDFAEKVTCKESSTNTCSSDFGISSKNVDDLKILKCHNRDINEGFVYSPTLSPPKKTMIHQSSMTNELLAHPHLDANSKTSNLKQLIMLFPNVAVDSLNDIYEKCEGDMNWIVDLLLDDNKTSLDSNKIYLQDWKTDDNDNDSCTTSQPAEQLERYKLSENKTKDSEGSESTCDFDDFDVAQDCETTSEQEMMELNLGDPLVQQLEVKFDDPNLSYPKGFQPVVQVPVDLARQLYMFYVESVYQQMEAQNQLCDMMIKEDEEFARKLQELDSANIVKIKAVDDDCDSSKKVVKIKAAETEGCDSITERALANLRESENIKTLTPEDVVVKSMIQKLRHGFPSVENSVLEEVLEAHNYNYKETVFVLMASMPRSDSVTNLLESPIPETIIVDMKETEKDCSERAEEDEVRTAASYRDEAFYYLQKRKELYQKAQSAYQSGMTQVALFYSEQAQKQTKYYDHANNMAATAFLNEHSKRHQNFDLIDLHFLFVKEAIPALDIFIDRNINLLQGDKSKKQQFLFVITGRGKRSENGKSKLKPAVIARLRKRKINFVPLNPGLLKIKILPSTFMSSHMN